MVFNIMVLTAERTNCTINHFTGSQTIPKLNHWSLSFNRKNQAAEHAIFWACLHYVVTHWQHHTTFSVTLTVTVTEALVLRRLLEDRGRITESVRILVPVNRIKQKCFQITMKRVHRPQQFQLRRQSVPCSRCSNRKSSVADSSTCPRHDEVTTRRGA